MAQQTKDPMLLMLWLGSLLWLGYDDQPKNFHMSWAQTKKKREIQIHLCTTSTLFNVLPTKYCPEVFAYNTFYTIEEYLNF